MFLTKILSLKENHLSSPESLADEAVGVREGGEGDSTIARPSLGPLQKNVRNTSVEQGHPGGLLLPHQSSSFVHHLSAPHSCGRE